MGGYGRRVADFTDEDLRGSRFDHVDLSGSEFRASDLTETRFRAVEMSRVVMRGVDLVDVDIHGEIVNLTINGVDIGPLVNAELDRRHPDRVKMRPIDPAGFRRHAYCASSMKSGSTGCTPSGTWTPWRGLWHR
jgi:hypothetical protein